MSFSYSEYRYMLLIVPMLTGIMIIVSSIYFCVCSLLEKDKFKGRLETVFIVVTAVWMVSSDSYEKLKNGGIYLAIEKETDAVVKESRIENIFDPSDRLNGFKSSYGADIEVDGRLFFIESVDNLSVGDKVLFKYLPKSTCVLEITKIE